MTPSAGTKCGSTTYRREPKPDGREPARAQDQAEPAAHWNPGVNRAADDCVFEPTGREPGHRFPRTRRYSPGRLDQKHYLYPPVAQGPGRYGGGGWHAGTKPDQNAGRPAPKGRPHTGSTHEGRHPPNRAKTEGLPRCTRAERGLLLGHHKQPYGRTSWDPPARRTHGGTQNDTHGRGGVTPLGFQFCLSGTALKQHFRNPRRPS